MVYSQCKCGNHKHYGSGMSPAVCSPCEECGTIPAPSPDSHPEPKPHDFSLVSKVETDEGLKTLSMCRYCYKSKSQIDRALAEYARKSNGQIDPETGKRNSGIL